jgi:hypothetical protein
MLCGPAQLNTLFEGVCDNGDKPDLRFLDFEFSRPGASTVSTPCRGVVLNACARLWALQHTKKKSFRGDHRSQPTHGTHAADLMLARAGP